jgi:hypothetical protein
MSATVLIHVMDVFERSCQLPNQNLLQLMGTITIPNERLTFIQSHTFHQLFVALYELLQQADSKYVFEIKSHEKFTRQLRSSNGYLSSMKLGVM